MIDFDNQAICFLRYSRSAAQAFAAGLALLLGGVTAHAQSLTVLPVNIEMAPKQMASTLTVINNGDAETSVQIRTMVWNQVNGDEVLTPSNDVMVSPPIATIAPGATQIVRLMLRKSPQGQEATYRILLDQIPPAATPGMVRIALRLSIPVFAAPVARVMPELKFHVENDAGKFYLVAVNNGNGHDRIREIDVKTIAGNALETPTNSSPYVLAGAMRRWPVGGSGDLPLIGDTVHLTGTATTGALDQRIPVVKAP